MRYIGREHGRIDTGEVHGERSQWPFGERRQQRAQAAGSLSVATIGVEMVLTGAGDAARDFLQSVQAIPMPRP